MKRYFNTREKAEKYLEMRRKSYFKKCDKMGWKVVGDNSFVYNDFIWKRDGDNCYVQTNIDKWFVWMAIVTDELLNDLKNYKGMDIEKIQKMELEAIEMAKGINKNIIKNMIKLSQNKGVFNEQVGN